MNSLETYLRNYTISKSPEDLKIAIQYIAEQVNKRYTEKRYNMRKKPRVMGRLFSIQLNIGLWPNVLQGEFKENFKLKVEAFLFRHNNDCAMAAQLMLKQCFDTLDKIATEG